MESQKQLELMWVSSPPGSSRTLACRVRHYKSWQAQRKLIIAGTTETEYCCREDSKVDRTKQLSFTGRAVYSTEVEDPGN
ncbi:hypothetical protein Nepgr_012262 [Nepenthes gracilis]|uniref:Uncharacterized protein n=1 Tax=Nepenthes gracilis TaxID=150966 RepID=A0AAD3SH81_NEPGR|nr:hypothetical protein Nepgr_012262 [Nepenthes gracilis]